MVAPRAARWDAARMSRAVDVDVDRDMKASAPAIWIVLEDLQRLPEWLAFAASLPERSGDRVEAGATYTVKPEHGYEPQTHWRVAAVEDRRQVHESEMPMISGVTSTIEVLEGADGRARAHVHWRGEPSTFMGRLMRPMFQRQITRNWERSLAALDRAAGA
jgi:hypothetical protein